MNDKKKDDLAGDGAPGTTPFSSARPRFPVLRLAAAVEVALALVVVARDLLIPTLVLLVLAGLSLLLRREPPTTLPGQASSQWLVTKGVLTPTPVLG